MLHKGKIGDVVQVALGVNVCVPDSDWNSAPVKLGLAHWDLALLAGG
jgi:hypothetical protein